MMDFSLCTHLLLLSTRDKDGAIPSSRRGAVPFGLATGLLLDLLRERRCHMDEEQFLRVTDEAPTGSALHDETLERIRTADARRFASWISIVHEKTKKLLLRCYEVPVREGYFRHAESRVLGLFPRHRFPPEEAGTRRAARLRMAVEAAVAEPASMDEGMLQLCALIHGCRIEHLVFDHSVRVQAKEVLRRICRPDLEFIRYPADVHRIIVIAAKATRNIIVDQTAVDASG
jgi:hypothetical protein